MSRFCLYFFCFLFLAIGFNRPLPAQECPYLNEQTWISVPSDIHNIFVLDGRLYCFCDDLLLTATTSSGAVVSLVGDTTFSSYDDKIDYAVRNPLSGHLFYTRYDSKGRHSLYEVVPREGKSPKTKRVRLSGFKTIDHPVFSRDGRVMFFSAPNENDNESADIYFCNLDADQEWTEPRSLGSPVNTDGDEIVASTNGDFLYYSSFDSTIGRWRINSVRVVLRRDMVGELQLERGPVYAVPEPINSVGDNYEIAFDEKNGRVYLASNRTGSTALFMYEGTLPVVALCGVVLNPSKQPVPDADISLFEGDNHICQTKTDEAGRYRFLLRQDGDYSLWVSKHGFFGNSIDVHASQIDLLHAMSEIVVNVDMEQIELGKPLYIFDVFGPDASVELSVQGVQKLRRIIRFLSENPHISIKVGVSSLVSSDHELNQIVTSRRIEALKEYLSSRLTNNKMDFYSADNISHDEKMTGVNAKLTIILDNDK